MKSKTSKGAEYELNMAVEKTSKVSFLVQEVRFAIRAKDINKAVYCAILLGEAAEGSLRQVASAENSQSRTEAGRKKANKPFEERRERIKAIALSKPGWKDGDPPITLAQWKQVKADLKTTHPEYKKVTDRQLNADAKNIGLRLKKSP